MPLTMEEVRAGREKIRKNCPTLKLTTGRGRWKKHTYAYGSGNNGFTEKEKEFLQQNVGVECGSFAWIPPARLEAYLEKNFE